MKFKKRILSEEIGLKKTNKKTFTKNKKQKVVISEEQLQRLIGKIKNPRVIKEIDLTWYIKFLEGVLKEWEKDGGKITDPNAWTNFKTQNQATFAQLGDRAPKSFAELKRMGGRTTKGLKEQRIIGYVCHHGACTGVNSGSFQYPSMQACQAAGCSTLGSPAQGGDLTIDEPMVDFSTEKPQTSPVKKKCCKCRGQKPYSLMPGKRCPKSCPEVDCKGTPPTQGNVTTEDRDMKMGRDMEMNKQEGRYNTPENMKACKAAGESEDKCRQGLQTGTIPPGTGKKIKSGFWCCAFNLKCCKGKPLEPIMRPFNEGRTLKTTNPITESEIKDMKKWFNRVNKSGREYNPSKI